MRTLSLPALSAPSLESQVPAVSIADLDVRARAAELAQDPLLGASASAGQDTDFAFGLKWPRHPRHAFYLDLIGGGKSRNYIRQL